MAESMEEIYSIESIDDSGNTQGSKEKILKVLGNYANKFLDIFDTFPINID